MACIGTDPARKAAYFVGLARAYIDGAKELLRLAADHDERFDDAVTRAIAALTDEQEDLTFALSVVRRLTDEAPARPDGARTAGSGRRA